MIRLDLPAELSAADGSVGWSSMIGCETPQLFALLPEATFDAIYADGPDVIVGGAFAPRGTAEAIDGGAGGYRVSGRWSFASGCQHARWLFGNCVVTSGGRPMPSNVAALLEARKTKPSLTPREVEVVRLIAQGLRNKEIAVALGISEETTKVHVKNILSKLCVNDRTAAVKVALQRGIIHLTT